MRKIIHQLSTMCVSPKLSSLKQLPASHTVIKIQHKGRLTGTEVNHPEYF